MSFENTRDALGERATLDGLIDGTLEELKDDCSVNFTRGMVIPNNTGLKKLVLPNAGLYHNASAFSTDNSGANASSGYIPGLVIIVVGSSMPRSNNLEAFTHCENLTTLDFPINKAPGFYTKLLSYCRSLKNIIIRDNRVVGCNTTNAFLKTPFESGGTGGTLYVPQAYIASYQNATNWSTLLSYENNQILPIEGSIYDGYYADGTPIE